MNNKSKTQRTKRLVEILRENDAPLGRVHNWNTKLQQIQRGKIKPYSLKLFRQGYERVASIYERINLEIQTEETGRDILRRTKAIFDKITPIVRDAITLAESQPKIKHDVPERVYDLIQELLECAREYRDLPAYRRYRDAQISLGGLTRAEWFEQGKPRVEKYDFEGSHLGQ